VSKSKYEFKRNFAIIIGINEYSNGIPALKTPVNDALKLGEILQSIYKYDIQLLLDSQATLEGLNSLLAAFKQKTLPLANETVQVTENDRVLFYFAGHGIVPADGLENKGDPLGYLVPQDARGDILLQKQVEISKVLLPMQTLHDALAELPCRHMLVILDCCFAGAFRSSLYRDIVPARKVFKQRFDRYIKDKAWQALASAAHDQKAIDYLGCFGQRGNIGGHSPFAEALFEGLRGAADTTLREGDGIITATELYCYLRDKIEELTEDHHNRQTPGLFQLKKHDKGEYIFLLPNFNQDKLENAPALSPENNPYRGLKSYEEEDSQLFFGRDELVKQLYDRISKPKNPLTVVLGVSGSGKSSIVKAGLVPYLRANYAGEWHILPTIRPGESPFTALAEAVLRNTDPTNTDKLDSINTLSGTLKQAPKQFINIIAQSQEVSPDVKLMLVIDQFEELITICKQQEREQFLHFLTQVVDAYPQQLRLLLTLRSDFEPRFLDSALKVHWTGARFPVRAMRSDELRQAIERPALEKMLDFDPPKLVDQLIDEVGQMPGALSLLSFTLSELYIKCIERESRTLSKTDYEALGGVAGSLTHRATEEYNKLDEAQKVTMRRVILRMVTIEGGESARRRVPLSELVYPDDAENKRVEEVIKRLSDARLIVGGRETAGEAYVEPAHDALVRGWKKLQEWKKEEEENLTLQLRITPAANDWAIGKGGLWTREVARLARLEKVLESFDNNWLNQRETEFVRNSIQTRQDELKLAEERRQAALARQLSAQAQLVRNQNVRLLPLSILLGLESLERFPSLEADRFLRRGLSLTPRYTNPILHNSSVRVLAFSPDGKYIATVSKEIALDSEGEYISNSDNFTQKICVLEVATGKLVHCIFRQSSRVISEEYQGIRGVIFSPPDGKYIATISVEEITKVQAWELATGEEVACISLGYSVPDSALESKDILIPDYRRNEVRSLSFSPDGKYLAIVCEDTTQKPEHWKSTKTLSDGKSYTARIMQSRNEKQVRVWKLTENQETEVWTQTSIVDAIAFNVDKESFYVAGSSSHDSTQVKVWEAVTGQVIASMPHENSALAIGFSPDGRYLATMTSADDRLIQVWEVSKSREVTRIYSSDTVVTVAFSLDGKYMVTVSGCQVTNEYIAQAWEINTISEAGTSNSTLEIACVPYSADLVSGRAAAISVNGKYLATASSTHAWVWEIKKSEAVATIPLESQVNLIAFSADGNSIIAAGTNTSANQKIHLWESATCGLVATLPQPDDLQAIAPSYDGKLLALAVGQESSCIQIWSIGEQNQIDNLSLNEQVNTLAFNRDGKCLCTCFATTVDKSAQTLDEQAANELNSEDSSYDFLLQEAFGRGAYDFLLQTATKTSQNSIDLQVREAATWEEIANIPHVTGMWNPVAISPDGQYVATAKVDETEESVELQVWDVATAQKIQSLRPRNLMPLRAIALSPKGTHLATLAVDTNAQVQVWEIASGKEIARIETEGLVIAIALEQKYLATVSQSFQLGNLVMQVWPWHPEALIHETCKRLTRNLTPEEWQQYLPDDPYRQICPILPNRVM
jgi:WD40 repeat protein